MEREDPKIQVRLTEDLFLSALITKSCRITVWVVVTEIKMKELQGKILRPHLISLINTRLT